MSSASSSNPTSIRSLTDACTRWSIDPTVWRGAVIATRSNPPPNPAQQKVSVEALKKDPLTKEQFLEEIRLKQQQAEERVRRMREEVESGTTTAAATDLSSDEDEEEDANENGDEKHDSGPKEEDDEDDSSEEEDEEDEESEYQNELEYFASEILCLDAINHDPPSGKEEPCKFCSGGKKFASEFACSACAYVRGVCATCRKVVVLKSLEDPKKGAAICLALISDEALLKDILEIEDAEEMEAVKGQIAFMLDAYFDNS